MNGLLRIGLPLLLGRDFNALLDALEPAQAKSPSALEDFAEDRQLTEVWDNPASLSSLTVDRIEALSSGRTSRVSRIPVQQAPAYLADGGTLRVSNAQHTFESIDRWLMGILADLYPRPVMWGTANIYLSAGQTWSPPHADGHNVLVIQLFGRKVWRYHQHPAAAWVLRSTELPCSERFAFEHGISEGGFPEELPIESDSVELRAGDVLFLPRGTLHATAAVDRSCHVTFALGFCSKLELFLAATRLYLGRAITWRMDAGLQRDAKLIEFRKEFAGISTESFAQAVDQYIEGRWVELIGGSYHWSRDAEFDRGGVLRVGTRHISVGANWRRPVEWMARVGRPFRVGEVIAVAKGCNRDDVSGLLAVLCNVGALAS